ncbi:zinc finger translocation-associated protein-like [Myxocyprinus asiaticus]|uniref:zinc finger translocation-associated protein-like n=1 Tax=Myxocyprinus asiaticus TaxID=70543 RepID=UPI0022233285|nr:zinc finger translocation-associated protein-like [Myxocyprinus asiaticus]
MEGNETEECVHKAEQTETGSLIIKTEHGEATPTRGHMGDLSAGEVTSGFTPHASKEGPLSPVRSPGTSYWCVSESPDSPFLLSPVPGPSTQEPPPVKPTPGRDHRRYYHEYWRSEYLMDFDLQRQGMLCMVCGSSLATLKLSTIKRHIRQKHPYSLLWSESDKEVIRLGWDSHLSLVNGQRPICVDPAIASESEKMLDSDQPSAGKPGDAVSPAPELPVSTQYGSNRVTPSPPTPLVQELPGPNAQVMERYLNDSLHAWFRQEFLMEYQVEAGRLVCMVCSCPLPSLHLDHIKSHVLDLHPNSLLCSAEEKHSILQTWAKANEPDTLQIVKSEHDTKEVKIAGSAPFFRLDTNPIEGNLESYKGGAENPPNTGQRPQSIPFPRKRRLKYGTPWRLRLDYLVAYGPPDNPLCYCMVCSEHLPVPRVSNFRKHIQACHPQTSDLSRIERDAVISTWTKEENIDSAPLMEDDLQSVTVTEKAIADAQVSPVKITEQGSNETEDKNSTNITPSAPTVGRNRHYPGKDQRRNYQARWRMDFLMDYNCRKHGLICMVCGASLATLKVSTIKRHILQVHPHSLDYGPDERQLVLLSYNQISLHFHSDDCFSGSNLTHKENANEYDNANLSTGQTSSQSTNEREEVGMSF